MAEQEVPAKMPEMQEIATAARNYFEPVFNGLLSPNDDTLATRGGGLGLKIYDQLERDPKVFSSLQKRKLAVIGREWQVVAASEDAIDEAAAAGITAMFKNLPFDRICGKLLDAILKGFAVGECMFGRDGSLVVCTGIKSRAQRRFVFDEFCNPRLLTQEQLLRGIELPERKFIVHRYGEKDENPYGLGLGSVLFWPVFFKRQGIQFWLTFADKFGSPTAVGEYPAGGTPELRNKLLAALRALSQESQVAIPTGMNIRLLEAQRGGAVSTYPELLSYMDEEILTAILGETMTTKAQAGGLGGNQSGTHNEVRLELAKADSDLLAETLNESIVSWLTAWNWPSAQPPRFMRDVSEPEDLKAISETDKNVNALGFELSEAAAQAKYGDGWTKKKARVFMPGDLSRSSMPAQPGSPEFAAAELDTPALQELRLSRESGAAINGWVKTLRGLVDKADSIEQLRDMVQEAYPEMSLGELTDSMSVAFAAAHAAGRFDILEEMR